MADPPPETEEQIKARLAKEKLDRLSIYVEGITAYDFKSRRGRHLIPSNDIDS